MKLTQAIFFILSGLVAVSARPCSVEDEPNRCMWEFLKLLGYQDQLPCYLTSALRDVLLDGIVFGRCSRDVPSEDVINALEQAFNDRWIPSCVVDAIKAIRPCSDSSETTLSDGISTTLSSESTTEYINSVSGSHTSSQERFSVIPDVTYSSRKPATGSDTSPKETSSVAPGVLTSFGEPLSVIESHTIPQETKPPTETSTVTSEVQTSSNKQSSDTSTIYHHGISTTLSIESTTEYINSVSKSHTSSQEASSVTGHVQYSSSKLLSATESDTSPQETSTKTSEVQTSSNKQSSDISTIYPDGTSVAVPYWKLPNFESSRGNKRVWTIPIQYTLIFYGLSIDTDEVFAALFQAQNDMIVRIIKGQDISEWTPDYLLEFPEEVRLAFRRMCQLTIAGQADGDYDFRYPSVISKLILQFLTNNTECTWEVINVWKSAYARVYVTGQSAEEIQAILVQSMGKLVLNGVITESEAEEFSTLKIAQDIYTGALAEKEQTGNVYYGPNDDILNPLYKERIQQMKDVRCVNRLEETMAELQTELQTGSDISQFVPPTLRSDLASFGLSAQEIETYLMAYDEIRTRFIMKCGSQINFTTEKPTETEEKWYSPDKRLQPVYQKLIDAGKMNDLAFATLGHWVDEIELFVQLNPSLIGYDLFVPITLSIDLDKFNQADRLVYENSYYELRNLMKTFVESA